MKNSQSLIPRQEVQAVLQGQQIQIRDLNAFFKDWPSFENPHLTQIRIDVEIWLEKLGPQSPHRAVILIERQLVSSKQEIEQIEIGRFRAFCVTMVALCPIRKVEDCDLSFNLETDSLEFSSRAGSFEKGLSLRTATLSWVQSCLGLRSEGVPGVPTDPLIRNFEVVGEAMRSCCSCEERCHMLREIEFFIEMSGAEQVMRLSDQLPTLKQYQHHRMGTGAVGACLALTEYCYQMRFPDEIKQAPEWDKLYTETNIIIGTTNDILSIKKEFAQGQIDTLIPVLYVQLGDVQLATDKAIELLYKATMRFDQAAGDFKHRYRNNIAAAQAVELFIIACRNACAGNLNWTLRSPRYDLPCRTRDGTIVVNLLTANQLP